MIDVLETFVFFCVKDRSHFSHDVQEKKKEKENNKRTRELKTELEIIIVDRSHNMAVYGTTMNVYI